MTHNELTSTILNRLDHSSIGDATSTEGYNTPFDITPEPDRPTPDPTLFLRTKYSNDKYMSMGAIKEEEYEEPCQFRMHYMLTIKIQLLSFGVASSTANGSEQSPEPPKDTDICTYVVQKLANLNLTEKRVVRNGRDSVCGGSFANIWRGSLGRREVA